MLVPEPAAGTTVVVVDAGDRPHGNGVWSRDEVILREAIPDAARRWVDAGHGEHPVILGYVRLPDGYLPLGRLDVSQCSFAADGALTECVLRLAAPLPWDRLDLVRPVPASPPPGLGWLERLPGDPIGALHGFIAGWPADAPAHSTAAVSVPSAVPLPLREFYRATAGRPELLGREDAIRPAARLRLEDGRLAFASQDEGEFVLVVDPGLADPEVRYAGAAGSTRLPLSGFLLHFALWTAATASPYSATAFVSDVQARRLGRLLRAVPLPPAHGPFGTTRHYAGPGVVVAVRSRQGATAHLWAGSRHRSWLRPLREPGFPWQTFDG